ncbi:hypothetical protein [Vibrio diabolicus]|nr:hypothetical protein [Vibrio diabolicus]MCS0394081.1 hypothetical protein [Vibrio diabolicus]MCS0432631.1 hypothetical protein [Vibrio diabolicus]
MKHFLPSSVMLTPFVVRYYDEDDDREIAETDSSTQHLKETEQQTETSD